MTAVAFHVNAPDRIAYACRLLRKAVGAGNRVLVTGEPQQLADIDQALWTFSALDFVPHCRADAPAEVLDRSPVVIAVPGRQVGKGRLPRRPRDSERTHAARLEVGRAERGAGEHHVHVAAEQVAEGLRRPLVGHVHELDAHQVGQLLHREVR